MCSATEEHVRPNQEELTQHCNLGYARCVRLPGDRDADAVRFCVAAAHGSDLTVDFVCERNHLPGEHGRLSFDWSGKCAEPHPDLRIQRLAECFVSSYMERRRAGSGSNAADGATASLFGDAVPTF